MLEWMPAIISVGVLGLLVWDGRRWRRWERATDAKLRELERKAKQTPDERTQEAVAFAVAETREQCARLAENTLDGHRAASAIRQSGATFVRTSQ